jgi:hypothetical protein
MPRGHFPAPDQPGTPERKISPHGYAACQTQNYLQTRQHYVQLGQEMRSLNPNKRRAQSTGGTK